MNGSSAAFFFSNGNSVKKMVGNVFAISFLLFISVRLLT